MIHTVKRLNNYIMRNNLLINILLILFFLNSNVYSKESIYFIEGMKHLLPKNLNCIQGRIQEV